MYALELPHDSNENTQHTVILLKIEKTSLNYPHLLPNLSLSFTLSGSNYPCVEQISMDGPMDVRAMYVRLYWLDRHIVMHTDRNDFTVGSRYLEVQETV